MSKKTVKLGGNAIAGKSKKPTKEDLKNIQEGVNSAGHQAMTQELSPEMKAKSQLMANRLNKIDEFCAQMMKEDPTLHPSEMIELLMVKARHRAFIHSEETDPSKILVWLIELVLFNANAIFAVTKAHLIAEKEDENAEKPQKQEKKSPKKGKRA